MVSEFAYLIRHAIDRRRMLMPGDRVLAGVSGGADSVCLLLVLKELGCNVSVAHLNHGLRGVASDEDESFTRSLAEKLAIPFFSKRVSIVKPSVEAAGRERRKEFFAELVSRHGFTKVALAHTRDDRIETFLMNLLRGAGTEGLVSMEPSVGNIIRPLIETSRTEIEAYLKKQRQDWRTDETNEDTAFARNRLRHELIPMLVADFNPNIQETLARTVEILEAEDDWMRHVTESVLTALSRPSAPFHCGMKVLVLDGNRLAEQPIGLVRRIIREAIRRVGDDLRDVSFEHVEAARSLLGSGKSGKFVQIPGGTQVGREFGDLVFRPSAGPTPEYAYELQIPGEVHIPELGKWFRAEISWKRRQPHRPRKRISRCSFNWAVCYYQKLEAWGLLQTGRVTSRKAQETVPASTNPKKSSNKLASGGCEFDDCLGRLISRFPRICSRRKFPAFSHY